ncbi:MAG TPA: VTT domain-containing protein [Vicinamibacterales bacterium]|nr:VTT domain-containing protein [Vicinamibacterales bacterium]
MTLLLKCLGCLAATSISAVFPWVNAELMVATLPAVAASTWELALLVVIATIGQMLGKCAVYWGARRGTATPSARGSERLGRWRARFAKTPRGAITVVLASSVVGIPPFYVTTMLAGALRMSFPRWLIAGSIGRLVRFGALVLVLTS